MVKILIELEARDSKPDSVLAAIQRCWTVFCQRKLTCDAIYENGITTYSLKDGVGNRVQITTSDTFPGDRQ